MGLIRLLQFEVFELCRIVWRNHRIDFVGHAPIQHLVMDWQVQLLVLNHFPDIGNHAVTLWQVGFRRQSFNGLVQFRVGKTGAVPA